MITAITDNPALTHAVAHRAAASRSHETFANALASKAPVDPASTEAQVRETAQQLVASTFIMPLLQQMREDPFKSEMFHGGFTEDAFGQQLDTILADRIAQRTGGSIVDAVYRSINKQMHSTAASRGVNLHG